MLVGKEDAEDDWGDEEDEYSTFLIRRKRSGDEEMTLFLNDEILLDNQASQCIFHNERLLHQVIGRDPYNMCGIYGEQSGLRVDQTGEIRGFERIGATVGLAEKASANILVQARLIDAGYGVRYDSTCDQYEVPMTFTRKVNHGRPTIHTCSNGRTSRQWHRTRPSSRGEKEKQQKPESTSYQNSHMGPGKG